MAGKKKNEQSGEAKHFDSRKSRSIALFGAGGVLIVLLIGAVVVMGSLLYQFTSGKGNLGEENFSGYPQGMLVIRDSPAPSEEEDEGDSGRLEAGDIARSAVLASATVKMYLPDNALTAVSSALGVVIDENGYILTSASVASENGVVEVVLNDGSSFRAKVVGYDLKTDIGIVKIEAENVRYASFSNASLTAGDKIIYLSLAQNGTIGLSEGTVSGRAGMFFKTPVGYSYQTLAATGCTESSDYMGGVVIDEYGQIVGIRCSYAEGDYNAVYTLSVNDAASVIDSIMKNGYVSERKSLNYKGSAVSEIMSEAMNIPRGVVIEEIEVTSGLRDADIMVGDIITAVNNVQISSVEELEQTISQTISGTVSLRIHRPSERRSHEEYGVRLNDDTGMYE